MSSVSAPDIGPEPDPDLIVREVARDEVTTDLIVRWRDLESRSCHVNAFLSPDFLLPAWKWLEPDGSSFLLTVEERRGGRLRALGCFQQSAASRSLPLPHLVAAKTIHSFRTGLLLDEDTADRTLDVWLRYLRTQSKWGGVVFPSLRLDSILVQRMQSAVKACNLSWHTGTKIASAAFFPPIASEETLSSHLSTHRRKLLGRKQRHLESLGPVRLRRIERPNEVAQAIEQFLILEDAGWKGVEGSSLQSNFAAAEFLRSMATGFFERGRLVLTQLLAGDHVVASSINLQGASTLFAFKIGWDPQFAKASPGTLHQILLLPLVCQDFPEVTCLDSCARPGSFLEDIWPHRITIADAVIPTSRFGLSAVAAVESVRFLKNRLRSFGG
jgi:CelD/BcsL family acetyltransferase involved in cellulose biosynthesis